jgi:EAL domain-containing protein (putative c-di-GMP-specific phosphodiesterase class I)
VLSLDALNLRLGHETTDHLLAAVADVLLTYVERVPGTLAGRLNGSDFVLCLPVSGVALETAHSLRAALAAAPALRAGSAVVVVGGVDGLQDVRSGAALAAADAALARAEAAADGDGGLAVEMHVVTPDSPAGASAWREQIGAALAQGWTRLAERRVDDVAGRTLHREAFLRVRLKPDGDYQSADRWLALARRGRLLPAVDTAVVALALAAIERDGVARAVRVQPASLATPGFIADVSRRLAAVPAASRRLFMECAEGMRPEDGATAVAGAAAAWRPLGVTIGVEYAAAGAQLLPYLQSAGVDYVKVDARHLAGLATEPAVRGYAQSLVALIHGLGLKVLAGGMADASDHAALWVLGFDGASSAAVADEP